MANRSPIAPLLRWVGGKRRLVRQLVAHLPKDIANVTYNEPFLGAASLFLFLQPNAAVLSDANQPLIDCYRFVRSSPDLVYRHLLLHAAKSSAAYYRKVRTQYNRAGPSAAQAARFIYLNKTCFNGIFRVNTNGKFNVPYGWKEPPLLPTLHEMRAASKALRRARLRAAPFEATLQHLGRGDFVYLDPPYPPLNGTSYFAHYTADRFSREKQEGLARMVQRLDRRGVEFLMSNADIPLIRQLYGAFSIHEVSVTRYVTCRATKHRTGELIITNYD